MERNNEHERIDLERDTTNRQDYEIEHGAKKYRACEFDCRGKHYAMVESRGQDIMIIGWEHGGETGECVECHKSGVVGTPTDRGFECDPCRLFLTASQAIEEHLGELN
jgi:hypothetical protein